MKTFFKWLMFVLILIPLLYFVGYGLAILLHGEAQILRTLDSVSASTIIFGYFVFALLITALVVLFTRKRY